MGKRSQSLGQGAAWSLAASLLLSCASHQTPQVDLLVAPRQQSLLKSVLAPASAAALKDVFVFGDSLSDTGRLKASTFGFYLPSEVYWHGRASNGPVWIDYVGAALGCRVHNYAVAGAATYASDFPVSMVIPSLADEVDEFLANAKSSFEPSSTLAVMWIGANNYLAKPQPPDRARADMQAAAQRLLQSPLTQLAIGTMPDLAGILQAPNAGRQTDATLRRSTVDHNRMVVALIASLQRQFPNKHVLLFDAAAINQATVEKPRDYGFTQLGEACYQGDYRGHFDGKEAFCSDYLGVKLWDYIHPNTRMHCHYATRLLTDLSTAGIFPAFPSDVARRTCNEMRGGSAGLAGDQKRQ